MTQNAVIFLAPGFEELEALAPADVFRRAGWSVVLCAVLPPGDPSSTVAGAHGVRVQCDGRIEDLDAREFQLAYLPGGMPGATNLAASPAVLEAVKTIHETGMVCAICAAPIVLDAAGLLDGAEYTCYPGFERHVKAGTYTGKFIQKSGRVLTACGPGAAVDFSLEILRSAGLGAMASSLAEGMQLRR
ncbi:MAG: DJ-1/PfpI family protein [Victivallales bacterium]|nr:DJ-1/PfpI family protein [Victivallales bacterium]